MKFLITLSFLGMGLLGLTNSDPQFLPPLLNFPPPQLPLHPQFYNLTGLHPLAPAPHPLAPAPHHLAPAPHNLAPAPHPLAPPPHPLLPRLPPHLGPISPINRGHPLLHHPVFLPQHIPHQVTALPQKPQKPPKVPIVFPDPVLPQVPLLSPTSIPDNANGGVELGKRPFSDGKYVHNPIGDKALPYIHDTRGDKALPYIHDKRGDAPS